MITVIRNRLKSLNKMCSSRGIQCTSRNTSFKNFNIVRELGRGTSSIVYKLDDKRSNKSYTCKIIYNKKKAEALREIKILHKLKNIEGFPQIYNIIKEDNAVSILTNYISGTELFIWTADHIKYNIRFDELLMKDVFRKMVIVAKRLHDTNFVHLDIKLENFLISYDNDGIVINMIDFGSTHQNKNKISVLSEIVGTAGYSPYEIYDGYYHPNSDVWSLGVCLWIFATGEFPFENTNKYDNPHESIFKFPTFRHLSYKSIISPLLFDLLSRIFKKKPDERICVDDILSSEWLNS